METSSPLVQLRNVPPVVFRRKGTFTYTVSLSCLSPSQTVQQRGAAVIKARKLSSAMSAAKAICDHMRDIWFGTPDVGLQRYGDEPLGDCPMYCASVL